MGRGSRECCRWSWAFPLSLLVKRFALYRVWPGRVPQGKGPDIISDRLIGQARPFVTRPLALKKSPRPKSVRVWLSLHPKTRPSPTLIFMAIRVALKNKNKKKKTICNDDLRNIQQIAPFPHTWNIFLFFKSSTYTYHDSQLRLYRNAPIKKAPDWLAQRYSSFSLQLNNNNRQTYYGAKLACVHRPVVNLVNRTGPLFLQRLTFRWLLL